MTEQQVVTVETTIAPEVVEVFQGAPGTTGPAGPTGSAGPKGDTGPGIIQPPLADRTVVSHTLGASPFTFTCPVGLVVQLTVTGGSGVALSVNPGNGLTTFIGGTGSGVILTSGESAVVSWTNTPNAIRTRAILGLSG